MISAWTETKPFRFRRQTIPWGLKEKRYIPLFRHQTISYSFIIFFFAFVPLQQNFILKPKYLLAIAIPIAAIAFLYFAGSTTRPPDETHNHAGLPPQASPDGMMGPSVAPASFDSLLQAAKKKLAPQDQTEISLLENNITRGNVKDQQIQSYETLGKLWLRHKNRYIAAHYFGASGKLENSEKKLNFAAHLLSEELQTAANPAVRRWMANEAIDYYNGSLAINPTNDTAKIDLAVVYIDGAGQTMKGIEQLLAVVRKDSTNVAANVILGKMAVESGQLVKAIVRGQTILSMDKNNLEAHLFMAEAYKRQGNKTKAIELFTEAKKIMNNPDFSKDVDAYIKTF